MAKTNVSSHKRLYNEKQCPFWKVNSTYRGSISLQSQFNYAFKPEHMILFWFLSVNAAKTDIWQHFPFVMSHEPSAHLVHLQLCAAAGPSPSCLFCERSKMALQEVTPKCLALAVLQLCDTVLQQLASVASQQQGCWFYPRTGVFVWSLPVLSVFIWVLWLPKSVHNMHLRLVKNFDVCHSHKPECKSEQAWEMNG